MDKITHEVRLSQWKQVIEQCQARPEGQTAKQWLAEKRDQQQVLLLLASENPDADIWAIRNGCTINRAGLPSSSAQTPVSFAEIPFPVPGESADEGTFQPTVVVKIGNASIAFSNLVSKNLLSKIILEVNSRARGCFQNPPGSLDARICQSPQAD